MVFWDMVVSLYVGCTFASMRWTCTFACIALSYIGFPNGARVFVTLLIRHAASFSPVLSRPVFWVVTAQVWKVGIWPHKRSACRQIGRPLRTAGILIRLCLQQQA